jgi:hypothetical protein
MRDDADGSRGGSTAFCTAIRQLHDRSMLLDLWLAGVAATPTEQGYYDLMARVSRTVRARATSETITRLTPLRAMRVSVAHSEYPL